MIRVRYLMSAIAAIPLLTASPVAQPSVIAVRHWPDGDPTHIAIDVADDFQFRSDRLLRHIRVAPDSPGVTRVVLQLADGVKTAASQSANPSWLDIQLRWTESLVSTDAPPGAASPARQSEKSTETVTKTAPATAKVERLAPRESIDLTLIAGRGEVIDCPDGVVRISTSSPEVVDAAVASDTEVLFHAKTLGQATLVVWSKSGVRRTDQVTVEPNLEPLRRLMRETFPDDQVPPNLRRAKFGSTA